ncbi:Rab3 GTPase-activating protein catalytic subunit [Psidium guajava]|nr:Rab3 GTPase-activating protein catalytic subunit [Psidium guajava]
MLPPRAWVGAPALLSLFKLAPLHLPPQKGEYSFNPRKSSIESKKP